VSEHNGTPPFDPLRALESAAASGLGHGRKSIPGIPRSDVLQALEAASGRSHDLQSILSDFVRALKAVGPFDLSVSYPEIGSMLNRMPDNPIWQDCCRIAETYSVPYSFMGTNGTTGLIALAVPTLTKPGDTILVDRSAHMSAYSGCVQSGARPIYVRPEYNSRLGIPMPITASQVQNALDAHADVRAVFLTYPTYWGLASDIDSIVEICRSRAVPLIADSAHGAYLAFHPGLPRPAEHAGATIVTQSTHKTLTALSQGSVVHIAEQAVADDFFESMLSLGYVSTSHSYVILASIALAVEVMRICGRSLLEESLHHANWVRAEVPQIGGLRGFGVEDIASGLALDPLRITVNVSELDLSGYAASNWMRANAGLYAEMATPENLLFLGTPFHGRDEAEHLIDSLRRLAALQKGHRTGPQPKNGWDTPAIPEQVLTPRQAKYAPRRRVSTDSATGHVSAERISCYPPGSAVIVEGERFTPEIIDYLVAARAAGSSLMGARDSTFETVSVITA